MKKIWNRIKDRAEFDEISCIASIMKEIKYQRIRKTTRLKTIIRKIIEWVLRLSFRWKFWIIWLLLVIIASYVVCFYLWDWASDFYGLSKKPMHGKESHSQIIRNLGWLVWMPISFLGLSIGLDLAIWGRRIQHKSHLQERYEKAASMLGNEVISVRVAGCRALMSLGEEDKSMKIQCVRLLFAFINNPYLKETEQNEDINVLFSDVKEPLRLDIQEAVNSFSAIYNYYGKKGIDDEIVDLPLYFWGNKRKGRVSFIKTVMRFKNLQEAYLIGANLRETNFAGAKLQKANLEYANLYKVNFRSTKLQGARLGSAKLQKAIFNNADLQGAAFGRANLQGANLIRANLREAYFGEANLKGANLTMADVTDARMILVKKFEHNISAKNLTKEQILSAIWGIDENGKGSPPSLPDEIKNDPEVQEWLKNPCYNRKEDMKMFAETEI